MGAWDSHSIDVVIRLLVLEQTKMERSNNESGGMRSATKRMKRTKDGRQTDRCYYCMIYSHLELDHAYQYCIGTCIGTY